MMPSFMLQVAGCVELVTFNFQPADVHAFASSGVSSGSASSSRTPAFFSAGDSAGTVSFAAPANSAVKRPVLNIVLRKDSHVVGGQSGCPVGRAWNQPAIVFA